jgi:D-beta-D-heptose 7-phosphate kinase/D-beta-D-heptose 1-phosphate adenosyltransferase
VFVRQGFSKANACKANACKAKPVKRSFLGELMDEINIRGAVACSGDLIKELKEGVASKHIVVVGDLMLDKYLLGRVERISPEAPVPILREESYEFSFGGATNVAVNCKHVGCNVDVIGLISDSDVTGKKLISMLTEKKIGIEGIVKSPNRVTTCKKRIVAKQQQLLRMDSEQTHELSSFERDNLICHIHTVIKPDSLVLISDYAKGVIDRQIIEEIIARAKLCDSLVVADPKGPCFDKYRGVHYLKPNIKEFHQMVEFFGLPSKEGLLKNGKRICQELQLKGLIVTMGEKGLQFIHGVDDLEEVDHSRFYPACKREVYDITGAGDTVLAYLAIGLVNGLSMHESLKLSNVAASVAVSHHKTYAVGLEELVEDDVEADEKIYFDWNSLKEKLSWLRGKKSRLNPTKHNTIVFTNGCFDLLHSGHIFLLEEAKKRGDILVVALNTDESVKRYKGENRPIKPLEERVKIIAAMGVVDYVVIFDQDTPHKLIDYLRPDLLIKGGDYQLEKIVGYDLVTSYGGKVEVVDYQEGRSTTNLVAIVHSAKSD